MVIMQRINKLLLNWASILEDQTRAQAVMTSQMPFIDPHLALMPDAYLDRTPGSARSAESSQARARNNFSIFFTSTPSRFPSD